ncbi:hypothetical protein [Psychroserpens luteolus]|uniref:hypothetical protein n=1 Tax=Psychroserpens luteolus TaxID=2855840 RepID=UPI001E5157BF|nr:hypothetical protein [Psychroserpens luteolus]MCD2258813.1 hypothetical protein [Psychroserpens luteolus]
MICCILLLTNTISAQSYRDDWTSRLSFVIDYGLSFPTIKGGNSFTISSFPSHPQDQIVFSERQSSRQDLSNLGYYGLELTYALQPKISLGLVMQRRNSYAYNSSMQFSQEKEVISNNLLLSATGVFMQNTKISSTSLSLLAAFKLFKIDIDRATVISFETGIGIGLSFIKLDSQISNVLLTMHLKNDTTSQDNTFGPGLIAPEITRTTPFTWQLSTGFQFQFENFPNMSIGFKLVDIGHFIIMERPENMRDLFLLTSATTNAEDQNLALSTTNQKRHLVTKDIYIKFHF